LLDSSFLEKARVAASRALNEIETLAGQVLASVSATDGGKAVRIAPRIGEDQSKD